MGRTGALMLKPGQSGESRRRADRGHQSGKSDFVNFGILSNFGRTSRNH